MFAAVPAPPTSHFAVSRPSSPTAYLPDCNDRRNRRATNLEGGPNSGRPLAFQVREFAFPATVLHSRPRLRFPMPLFPLPEHKIEVFVRFYPSKPSFSGCSSTKSRFLCAFTLRNPSFQAFRAQNRVFCALLPSETLVFGLFEHKIGVFVRFYPSGPPFSAIPSTKSRFLCAFASKFFPIMVFMGSLPTASSRWLFATAPWPATFSRWRSATAAPLTRSFATAPRPATNLIRRRKVLRFG